MDLLLNDGTMQEFIRPILLSLKTALVAGMIVIERGTLVGRAMARRYFRGKLIAETISHASNGSSSYCHWFFSYYHFRKK